MGSPWPPGDPDTTGLFPPPPGITPNFKNPEHRTAGIVPLTAVFLSLSTIFLLLRLYTKAHIIKVVGWEDAAIIGSWICNAAVSALSLVNTYKGNGVHEWNVPLRQWPTYFKVGYSAVIIYVPAVCLAKVAILIFYLRLNPTKYFRISVYVILGIVCSYMIALVLALIFQCTPIRRAWEPLVPGTCIPNAKLYMANSMLNVITDFLVLLVPIPMILGLHTSSRQKWIIAGLFTLGSLTSVLSAIRTYYIHELVASPDDANWRVTTSSTLVVVETNLSVICGCLMVLRPFVRRHLPRFIPDYGRYRKAGPQGTYDGPSGPNSRSNYKAKVVSATSKGSGSGTGRSWFGRSGLKREESDEDSATITGDVELGERGAGKGRRTESEEHLAAYPAVPMPGGEGIIKTVDVRVR